MKNKITVLLVLLLILGACGKSDEKDPDIPDETPIEVVGGGKGEYPIILPFITSPLRQEYANYYREIDMMEIGRQLQNHSKDYFKTDKFNLSEGTLITPERYYELIGRESETNIYALNKNEDYVVEGVTIPKPVFVSDLVEINFHDSLDRESVDGVSVAMVMKRIQTTDRNTGATMRLSDSVLYEVGVTLGQQLHSYLRTLPNMSDKPIMIAMYVQESDEDRLPGKYLPGHFLGHALFESARNGNFVKTEEKWELLNGNYIFDQMPETYTAFTELKRRIFTFMGDENVAVVGKGFLGNDGLEEIQLEISTGSKTYLEVLGLAESMKTNLNLFDQFKVPIVVEIKIFQSTKIVVSKLPGQDAVVIKLN